MNEFIGCVLGILFGSIYGAICVALMIQFIFIPIENYFDRKIKQKKRLKIDKLSEIPTKIRSF